MVARATELDRLLLSSSSFITVALQPWSARCTLSLHHHYDTQRALFMLSRAVANKTHWTPAV